MKKKVVIITAILVVFFYIVPVNTWARSTGITKDQGTVTLQGEVYEVKDPSGKVVATLTTNAQGTASTGNLPLGTYTLKETKASYGFEQDPTTYTMELTADNMKDTSGTPTKKESDFYYWILVCLIWMYLFCVKS